MTSQGHREGIHAFSLLLSLSPSPFLSQIHFHPQRSNYTRERKKGFSFITPSASSDPDCPPSSAFFLSPSLFHSLPPPVFFFLPSHLDSPLSFQMLRASPLDSSASLSKLSNGSVSPGQLPSPCSVITLDPSSSLPNQAKTVFIPSLIPSFFFFFAPQHHPPFFQMQWRWAVICH